MNEIQIRNDIIKKAKLYEWFGNEGIINIQKEYNVGYNRYVDLMVETEKQMILIEIKKELNSYDIGQILTYEIICQQHKKNIKLVLLVNKSIPKELKLFNAIIKKYNLDIMLIVYGNETCKLRQNILNKRSNKIGFDNKEPMIVKIVEFLKNENMQGKQFPTAKVSDYLKCKRYEIDQLKPKLIEEKIIYKCNSKSYRVADFI